jgi:hypothetical protein
VHLIREVLDNQLLDSEKRGAGKVDGIVLELRDGLPPRLAYIEVGPITLLDRFSRRLAEWYARIDARFGAGRGRPIRIPWTQVAKHDVTLFLLDAHSTPIFAVEDWLAERIVSRIPGGRQS